MSPPIRRVITGETDDGRSVFTRVEAVEPHRLGGEALRHIVWNWSETPTLPHDGLNDFDESLHLPGLAGAVQIETWVLPPNFPLAGAHPDAGRMHSTDTVDVVLVLEGELRLRQENDDREVALTRGDIVVQNGARHAWYNPRDEPVVVAEIFFGTSRRP